MKTILAPMAEISHSALRRLIADFAEPDEYFTEMIHAPSAISGGTREKWYFCSNPSPEKLIWQITSPEVEAAIKATPLLLSYGGIGIDLNMGCCAPQIVRTGAGFAWMQKPLSEVASFVSGIKKEIIIFNKQQKENSDEARNIRLSVKLRLGETEDYDFLLQFCKTLVDEGVDLITLHPRTQKQKYSRPCKHEFTARLASDLSIPVYGNGDINSYEKLKEISEKYKCTGWMIGRAAVQKPWIFHEINSKFKNKQEKSDNFNNEETNSKVGKTKIDLLKVSENFINYLKEEQAPEFYMSRALRFYVYFCDNLSFAHFAKSKILNAKTIDDMHKELIKYLDQAPQDKELVI